MIFQRYTRKIADKNNLDFPENNEKESTTEIIHSNIGEIDQIIKWKCLDYCLLHERIQRFKNCRLWKSEEKYRDTKGKIEFENVPFQMNWSCRNCIRDINVETIKNPANYRYTFEILKNLNFLISEINSRLTCCQHKKL